MIIGRVSELARYPVKSMAAVPMRSAYAGLHGLAGDRRFAFRRVDDRGGFPFLTAGRFPDMLTYQPSRFDETTGEPLPTHVRTPSGAELELRADELRNEIASRSGHAVELMMFKHGIFDDGQISVISFTTIAAIGDAAGMELDRRRMRANVVLDIDDLEPFGEDEWVGATLVFGDTIVSITARDERCAMVNMDPDTGRQDPRVMKAVVRMNDNYAGVYGTVVRPGTIEVGQSVRLIRTAAES